MSADQNVPPLFRQRTKKGTAQQTENCLAEHPIKKNPVVSLHHAIKGQVWPLNLFYCFHLQKDVSALSPYLCVPEAYTLLPHSRNPSLSHSALGEFKRSQGGESELPPLPGGNEATWELIPRHSRHSQYHWRFNGES